MKENLFEFVKKNYDVYPEILGYWYQKECQDNPDLVKEIAKHEYVFISSDFSDVIPGCEHVTHVMTSGEPDKGCYMWLMQEFLDIKPLPCSEWTGVPSIGFVGRCPIFTLPDGRQALHSGFEPRYHTLVQLDQSSDICTDFHIRYDPAGDSAGFFNESHPHFKSDGPLFRNNMLANQYQVCARGNANWSLRFYETLVSGRIPLYIESGGLLPISGDESWLNEANPPFPAVSPGEDAAKVLLEFHEKISGDGLLQSTQYACRDFFEDNFSQKAQIQRFKEIFG